MNLKEAYKNERKGVIPLNDIYQVYYEETADSLILEVDAIDAAGNAVGSGAARVSDPTLDNITVNLRYAAIKAIYAYLGSNVSAPTKPDAIQNIDRVSNNLYQMGLKLTYEKIFRAAASRILQAIAAE